jgi:5-methylcytosine-specific restriction endonuclease McrA
MNSPDSILPVTEFPDYLAEIRDIEDLLFPQLALSVWERTLYYHLFRHTRLAGTDSVVFPITMLAQRLGASGFTIRKSIRSLHQKKCIVIDERSRQGHSIRILLPSELGLSAIPDVMPIVAIESIDFFTGRNYVAALLVREGNRCFYCHRAITSDNCVLDHVNPQVNGIDNSFRNVVAACHECNSRKRGNRAESFLRMLYREAMLTQAEFTQQTARLEALEKGQLVPDIIC